MTSTIATLIQVNAIPAVRLQQIRAGKSDDNGDGFEVWVDEEGGAPVRCCLRDSRPGERLALIGYRPFQRPGPYAETGPVFIHATECGGYPDTDRYPDEFRSRQQMFRCYRADGTIAGGRLVEPGGGQEDVAAELFTQPDVALVHSRNVIFGCYMFEITRGGVADPSS